MLSNFRTRVRGTSWRYVTCVAACLLTFNLCNTRADTQTKGSQKTKEAIRQLKSARNYYELRIYDVTPGKLAGVQERFRETVDPVRRKHGIECLGYWSAAVKDGEKFLYLIAASSAEKLQQQEKEFGADVEFQAGYAASNKKHGKTVENITVLPLSVDSRTKFDFTANKVPRTFELRLYSVPPDKLSAFRTRWQNSAVPIYERHGLHSIGWWIAAKKDADGNHTFVCLLSGKNSEAIQKSIGEFHQDKEWLRVESETEQNGKLRSGVTAYRLTPIDFSALK